MKPKSKSKHKLYSASSYMASLFLIMLGLSACSHSSVRTSISLPTTIELKDGNEALKEFYAMGVEKLPMVYERRKGKKHLIYIGVGHSVDPSNPMFDTIQKYFFQMKPTLALNEGGSVSDSIRFDTKNDYIRKNGELYFLKYLTQQSGIKMINGDCSEAEEFANLSQLFDKKLLHYYYVLQRFLGQTGRSLDNRSQVKIDYEKFIKKEFVLGCKMNLSKEQQKWEYFEDLYKTINKGEQLDLATFEIGKSQDLLETNDVLGKISNASLRIRDEAVVKNIARAFQKHDKVFVVFGALHLITEMPSLEKMFVNE